jgi:YihY family inner membrane protein
VTDSFPVPVYEEDVRTWLATELTKVGHATNLAGVIGGVGLFWLASILFSTLRTSLNAVLNMPSRSNLVLQKVRDFLLMIVILVLLLSSTFLSPIVTLLQHLGTQVLPWWLAYVLDTAIPRFVSLGISIALYVLLFRMLPHERLSRKVIFISAATTVFLTEAMRLLFVYYMKNLSSIGTLYGTYAFIVGISIWVYYASTAFLIGAEVGWLYKERHEIVIDAPLSEAESVLVKHPGPAALSEEALESYEQTKSNPTKPAGDMKPPAVPPPPT